MVFIERKWAKAYESGILWWAEIHDSLRLVPKSVVYTFNPSQSTLSILYILISGDFMLHHSNIICMILGQ
ncbi:unnamed protein product [Cylindrotheca closterium]|uniref:Uncharacterized protein n=1 Tax=Cylindrotheca closterium TaxID=2856 RepID=A0AAD2JI32_9STRA|nr:unnamed protein product [Cylindrotheca closterium]